MPTSNVKSYIDDKEVLDGFNLGGQQVVATETGLCKAQRRKSQKNNTEYETKKSISTYSFIEYDSIEGIELNERQKNESPNYDDTILMGFTGFMALLSSMIVPEDIIGIVVTAGIGLILASLIIAISRSSTSEKGTNLKLRLKSDEIPSSEWEFHSRSVNEEDFQKFVRIVSKQLD